MDAHILQSIQSLMMSWFRLQAYIRIILENEPLSLMEYAK
jgi:hypothetical protein